MAGESQQEPVTGAPDPSVLTTEQMLLAVENARLHTDQKIAEVHTRMGSMDRASELLHDDLTRFPTEIQKEIGHLKELTETRLAGLKEVSAIRESYRMELKMDSEKALGTALTAAEKAVQAALAAAEKARDQQTIASQLATDKAEKSFVEALAQLNATFTVAIANVVDGINETKAGVAELRNIKRGSDGRTTAIYGFVGFLGTILIILTVLLANGVLN